MEENSPANWTLPRFLSAMQDAGASDLFVHEGKSPAMRIRGEVVVFDVPETTEDEITALLDTLLSESQRAAFDQDGDLDVGYTTEAGQRFRFNLARSQGQTVIVARAIPAGELTFEDLGLPEQVQRLAERHRGLVLVTGATGSGKSTTLAAMIHHINSTRSVHIVSIEDPIEYQHADVMGRVTQREVGSDTRSFDEALRHVVRESPDVIVIGEIRDIDTMAVAVQAALTGHLVFGTLHTVDATQTVQRVLNLFPMHLKDQAAIDLSICLEGIVSQRLVPRDDEPGRVVAVEVLVKTPPVKQLLREQRSDDLHDLMKGSGHLGMQTFNRALLNLHEQGLVSHDVGLAYASNPDEFALAARGMQTGVATFRKSKDDFETRSGLDLKMLLKRAIGYGASDLHVAVGRPPMYRIAGQLRALKVPPLSSGDMRVLLYATLTARQRTQYELERELDFALQLETGERFRVNAYYQKGFMAASFRAIPSAVLDPETLGLPAAILSIVERPHGLFLAVGPTGAGKTTTLACLLDQINRTRACRIITVEDPIEYVHESQLATVDQREVYADTKDFSTALKYVLRQDPDVILIGEMRDLDTISAALTAAETGHLVLATLHSNDAMQAIDRIVDVFPAHQQGQARAQLAASLAGVVSQRLLPRKDGQGRVAAFEVMLGTAAVRTLVRDNKMHQAQSIMETARKQGMSTLDQSLLGLVRAGLVAEEEAARFVTNPMIFGQKG